MENFGQYLSFDLVFSRLKFVSVPQIFMHMAEAAAPVLEIGADVVYQALMARERAMPSGVGGGLALSDIKIPGSAKPVVIVATLKHDVDFNALDSQPVRVMGLVISPERDGPYHLRRLSRVSRLLKDNALHEKLLGADDEAAVRSLLMDSGGGWLMAA